MTCAGGKKLGKCYPRKGLLRSLVRGLWRPKYMFLFFATCLLNIAYTPCGKKPQKYQNSVQRRDGNGILEIKQKSEKTGEQNNGSVPNDIYEPCACG